MREHDWNGDLPAIGHALRTGDTSVSVLEPPHLVLLSGDIEKIAEQYNAPVVGLAQEVSAESFLLRLARDRALWVAPPENRPPDGWQEHMALSNVDGGYAIIEMSGQGASALLQQGSTINLATPSPSASLLFAGHSAALARLEYAWWLFIEPGMLAYYWQWVAGAVRWR